jgi:hypothetical protein
MVMEVLASTGGDRVTRLWDYTDNLLGDEP